MSWVDTTVQPPAHALMAMLWGRTLAHAIGVAAELGVADLLAGGARSVDDLAAAAGAHPASLYRLLRALAGAGVFNEPSPRTFANSPLSECLRAGDPSGVRALAVMTNQRWSHDSWRELAHAVRTGIPAFDHVHGAPVFDWFSTRPGPAKVFDQAMTGLSAMESMAVVSAYDFSPFETIVDVAGRHGSLLGTILAQVPRARGVLFDLPHVVAEAKTDPRVEIAPGSFFERVPPGG
jgi:hypothetical protein